MRSATSLGFSPSFLASARAAFAWKSANWLGRITGSASACSSPNALPRARWNRSVSTPTGLATPPGYRPASARDLVTFP